MCVMHSSPFRLCVVKVGCVLGSCGAPTGSCQGTWVVLAGGTPERVEDKTRGVGLIEAMGRKAKDNEHRKKIH